MNQAFQDRMDLKEQKGDEDLMVKREILDRLDYPGRTG